MAVIPPQLCAFTKSDPSRETANIQLQVAAFSFDKPGEPPHPFPAFTVWTNNLRPTSRGHLRVKSADARPRHAFGICWAGPQPYVTAAHFGAINGPVPGAAPLTDRTQTRHQP